MPKKMGRPRILKAATGGVVSTRDWKEKKAIIPRPINIIICPEKLTNAKYLNDLNQHTTTNIGININTYPYNDIPFFILIFFY